MPLCFAFLFPPRMPDGPLPRRSWRRLAASLTTLLLLLLAMMAL